MMSLTTLQTDVLDYPSNWGNCPKKKKAAWNIIWRARKDFLFNKNRLHPTKVVDTIKNNNFHMGKI
ncbi:hypothetical protein LXL04_035238 [Taraxacum kok-saghyz]